MKSTQLRWKLLLAWIVGFSVWCAAMTLWQRYYEASLKVHSERQKAYETKLSAAGLPVFGEWLQVGPFDPKLEVVQKPEEQVDFDESYSLWKGGRKRWSSVPEYYDGYANSIIVESISTEVLKHRPTVCLARLIQSRNNRNLAAFLGCDGGFTVWLNGERILYSATVSRFAPGQDTVVLPLKAGVNRLVLRIQLNELPCRFFFAPDIDENIFRDLHREFPNNRELWKNYRQQSEIHSVSRENDFYRLTELPTPSGTEIEGGGLDFDDRGRLWISTRRGFVYVVANASDPDPADIGFSRFAGGLHEGFGLIMVNGSPYVVQRGQLTHLIDEDHDGHADRFENIYSDWGLTGNYHEYAYGVETDDDGHFFITLNASSLFGKLDEHGPNAAYRGCVLRIAPTGESEVFATGFRSPNGIGKNAEGDLFVTDNQGQWVPACPLYHLRRDHYYGHPASKRWAKSEAAQKRTGELPSPPAVWFPYDEFAESATDVVCDTTNGKFGPFAGQLFIGEMTKGLIIRVALEKVADEYQGACFIFRRGCGAVNRMAFGPSGELFLTRTNRGWGGAGRGDGIARLTFSGHTPMEIHSVSLQKDGFHMRFTEPIKSGTGLNANEIRVEQFRYHYWKKYGSPKINREILPVKALTIDDDRLTLRLKIDRLKPGRVCHILMPHVSGQNGDRLLHAEVFYTINHLRD